MYVIASVQSELTLFLVFFFKIVRLILSNTVLSGYAGHNTCQLRNITLSVK